MSKLLLALVVVSELASAEPLTCEATANFAANVAAIYRDGGIKQADYQVELDSFVSRALRSGYIENLNDAALLMRAAEFVYNSPLPPRLIREQLMRTCGRAPQEQRV